jgi:hypothetical protein
VAGNIDKMEIVMALVAMTFFIGQIVGVYALYVLAKSNPWSERPTMTLADAFKQRRERCVT